MDKREEKHTQVSAEHANRRKDPSAEAPASLGTRTAAMRPFDFQA